MPEPRKATPTGIASFLFSLPQGESKMRDPELLISILEEMAQQPDGRLKMAVTLGRNEEMQRRIFHIELLRDADLVEWGNIREFPRITNQGFNFIETIRKKKGAKEKVFEMLDKGEPLLNTAKVIIDVVGSLTN